MLKWVVPTLNISTASQCSHGRWLCVGFRSRSHRLTRRSCGGVTTELWRSHGGAVAAPPHSITGEAQATSPVTDLEDKADSEDDDDGCEKQVAILLSRRFLLKLPLLLPPVSSLLLAVYLYLCQVFSVWRVLLATMMVLLGLQHWLLP
ncbi:hypothetical protein HanPSC8_Chr16g0709751 [Helianthus annuus]|nr:hypothetical protein HanPSC8_Chr16g0709751 [Helianthus annuus]